MANLGTIGKSFSFENLQIFSSLPIQILNLPTIKINLKGVYATSESFNYKKIEGMVYKNGIALSVPVYLFDRDTKQLLLSTNSDNNGYFVFNSVPSDLSYFYISLSIDLVDSFVYNAIIKDNPILT